MSNPFTRITKIQLAIMAFAALAALALPLHGRLGTRRAPAQAPTPYMPTMPSGGMAMPQTLVCPLWRVSPDLVAKIHIKNALMVAPLAVTPTLYMADGTPYQLPPITIPMSGEANLNINQALQSAPASLGGHVSDYGSAGLTYMWDGPGHVSASMNMKDLVHSLTFHQAFLDLPSGMNSGMSSTAALSGYELQQVEHVRELLASYHVPTPGAKQDPQPDQQQAPPLNGLWWKRDPGVAGFFALANTSSSPIEVRYRVSGSGGAESAGLAIGLGPKATAVVALDPLLASLPPDQRTGGGIEVEQLSGPAMAASASGWLENDSEGFSASIEFESGDMPQSVSDGSSNPGTSAPPASADGPVALAAAGLMLGKPMSASGFPDRVRFRPYGYLRSASSHPLLVTVSANVAMGTMGMTGTPAPPQVSQSFKIMLSPHTLAPVALAPLAHDLEQELARKMGVDAGSIEGAMLNWSASYDGQDGDVLMTTGSTDQTGNYVFEVMPVLVGNAVGYQLPYWNTAHGNDTMYSIWNPGTATQSVVLTLYSADGMHTYAIPVTLAPGASTMVDIGMLRKEGVPDPSSNLLPPEIQDGSAMLEPAAAGKPGPNGMIKVPKSGPAQMQVVVSAGVFNAQTATCCGYCISCCFFSCAFVSNASGGVGSTLQSEFCVEDCCGNLEDMSDYGTWSSADTSICTSQGGGAFDGVGVGGAGLDAEALLESASASNYPVCAQGCKSVEMRGYGQGTVNPGLTITMGLNGTALGNSDISNQTESVITGQEVQLQANYNLSGGSLTSQGWTVNGAIASGWSTTAGNGPTPVNTSVPLTTIYWTAPGSAQPATFTLNYTDGNGNPQTATATAKFTAAGPTSVSVSPATGAWAIVGAGPSYLQLTGLDGGITFPPAATPPAGAYNKFFWVQVLTSGGIKVNGSPCTLAGGQVGLDDASPYPFYVDQPADTTPTDSPSAPLFSSATDETRDIAANMWLLWEPAGSNGVVLNGALPVPLGYVPWSAHGEVTGDGLGDFAIDQTTSIVQPGSFTASTSYPTWGVIVPSPENISNCGGQATNAASALLASPQAPPRQPGPRAQRGH